MSDINVITRVQTIKVEEGGRVKVLSTVTTVRLKQGA